MNYIDAHVHVWTPDTAHYPLAAGFKKEDMKPASFTPQELFKHSKPAGVARINLIQMSHYGFENKYMLDMIAMYPEVFVGTAVIDPAGADPAAEMTRLSHEGVRAFRIHPRLSKEPIENWLTPSGFSKMFDAGVRNKQAMSCLINPDALPDLDRMCRKFSDTPVIIDHLCRIGSDGSIRDKDITALTDMSRHKNVFVKLGAFYALGKKKAPYTDLADLIEKVLKAFTVKRCMWESDCPFQVSDGHNYADSIDLIKKGLKFLSDDDKDWLLRKTAEDLLFRK
jgi:predicted TIM-barrel fold metal-dependent hydrolase